jgi:hypothetical protein
MGSEDVVTTGQEVVSREGNGISNSLASSGGKTMSSKGNNISVAADTASPIEAEEQGAIGDDGIIGSDNKSSCSSQEPVSVVEVGNIHPKNPPSSPLALKIFQSIFP